MINKEFEDMKDFIKGLIDSLTLGNDGARVGLISFAASANIEFHLNKHTNKQNMKNEVMSITKGTMAKTRTGMFTKTCSVDKFSLFCYYQYFIGGSTKIRDHYHTTLHVPRIVINKKKQCLH